MPARFGLLPELRRLGAEVQGGAGYAVVTGVARLRGASLRAAADLHRAAALVIAALAADGESTLEAAEALARGYQDLSARLRALGADVAARA